MKSFYEFNGNWLQIFDKLVGIITPVNIRRFTIWQSKSANGKSLLIVSEIRLEREWEYKSGINQISETEFLANYRNKMNNHRIHGFNEYNHNNRASFNLLRKLTAMF